MSVTPETHALLSMMYRVNAPRFHELDVHQARRSFAKLQFALGFANEAVASVLEIPIPREDGSVLLARLCRPSQARSNDTLPLLIYFHGGGWTVGDVESYDGLCRRLCNRSGHAVLSVEYRLAPEHPFPAAVDDAVHAVQWVIGRASDVGLSFASIALAGDSAGGNLAAVAAIHLRDRVQGALRGLVLVYPCVTIASERPSRAAFSEGFVLDRASLDWFFSHYLPDGGEDHWRASPLNAETLAGLPPILMLTAGLDPLTDDCREFAGRVVSEGGRIVEVHVEGVPHGFFTLGKHFPEADSSIDAIASFLSEI